MDFDCQMTGRYVSFSSFSNSSNYLTLCMVGVYADCDCSNYLLDPPSVTKVEATVLEATTYTVAFPTTKTLPAGAFGCGATGSLCDQDYEITLALADGSPLPAWMSFEDQPPSDSTLAINPALASPGDGGSYEVHAKRFEKRYP